MHLIHYWTWLWYFGALLYSMRLIKCLQTGAAYKSPYLLSLPPSLFCLKLVCFPRNFSRSFPPGSVTTANLNFPTKVLVWAWPSHLPLNVAQQFLPSSETEKECSTSASTRGSYCMSAVQQSGSHSTSRVFPLLWKATGVFRNILLITIFVFCNSSHVQLHQELNWSQWDLTVINIYKAAVHSCWTNNLPLRNWFFSPVSIDTCSTDCDAYSQWQCVW